MEKKEQTYGEAMKELQEIMNSVENDNLDVDVLMQKVKKATELIKFCKEKLLKTNSEIQKVLDNIE